MSKIMPVDEFRDALAKKVLSRRDVVRTLAGVGVATVTTPLIRNPAMAQDAWLYLFTWNGYELPELHPAFTEKYGREPDVSFYADNDEALEKIRAGFDADIVCPSGSTVIRWIHAGLIEPIDVSRLSHWPDMFDQLQNIRGTVDDNGNHYYAGIPAADRHDAHRRRFLRPRAQGLHLRRHGLFGAGRGAQHVLPPRPTETAEGRTGRGMMVVRDGSLRHERVTSFRLQPQQDPGNHCVPENPGPTRGRCPS